MLLKCTKGGQQLSRLHAGRAVFLVVLLFIVFQTGAALAQETSQGMPVLRRAIVWTNPILLVFGWFTGEAEIRLQENHTVGVSGSFLEFEDGEPGDLDFEDTEYSSVSVFYRYYPTGSFKGFFLGGQLGSSQVTQKENAEDPVTFLPTGEITDVSVNVFTAGVLIGYGWVLGEAERVSVSLGIGANRLFGGDLDDDVGLTLPVVRLINVGVAF